MANATIMRNRLLRTACDRCHSQKLRCPRPSKADSDKGDKTCNRCRRAGKICVFSKRGKSGRPSKIVTAGARLRSSFLAEPAESEISTRGSITSPSPEVPNPEAILDSVTVQSEPEASKENIGSVRHSAEDTRTLSLSDVPLPSCTLGQEAMPAPTVLAVLTANSDHQPLSLETDSTQTLKEVEIDFPTAYDLGTHQFNTETQSIPTPQLSESPNGLGSETWSDFLLSSNLSFINDIPNPGVQLHQTVDKQGSIFNNSDPAAFDLSASGHFPFLDCGNAIDSHPFGDVTGVLSGLNSKITCALANYKAMVMIDDSNNLQLYHVVQDIIDISRQLIAITKQCLPYIPTTPDSSPASSPSSAVDELPDGSSRTGPTIFDEHVNWSRVIFPFLACYSLALDYFELVLNGLYSVPRSSLQSSLDASLIPNVFELFFTQIQDAFVGSQTSLLDPPHSSENSTIDGTELNGIGETPLSGKNQSVLFLDTALDEIRERGTHLWDRSRKLGMTRRR
ncbi:uncharacterized protein FIESC28_02688 [Fusarium coffeatum]|uniref:Zn(2)-C6 fungal-type domain-containing protein n=1 Tax=Fusarium coffeatum TaxID=231269 RepID=A0A366S658_9HYPO|nr:uncharacterized protein FIESC28_02688 [Fusarium coffeatum]RBR24492.1 hypothetical protein FIESC28_02688 [Fusarium coffeatum]